MADLDSKATELKETNQEVSTPQVVIQSPSLDIKEEPKETDVLMAKKASVESPKRFNWPGTIRALIGLFFFPNLFIILPYIVLKWNGDYWNAFINENVSTLVHAWRIVKWDILEFYLLIIGLTAWGSFSILFFGGRRYYGPVSASGHKPEYTHSGFRFYIVSMIISVPLIVYFPVRTYYDNFVSLVVYLTLYSVIVATFLYIKGLYWPSPGERQVTGNPLLDFYQGTELYPRIGSNLDLKTLITCRHCLFLLQLIYLIMWKSNAEIYGLKYYDGSINWPLSVVTLLQTVYLGKWFYWEDGYKSTIDFILDRLGFYLGGACISLIPSMYSLYNLYMVNHYPVKGFGAPLSIFVFIMGLAMIGLVFWSDKQRQLARLSDGKCTLWGKPAEVIRVTYTDTNGQERHSLILASGFWGVSRHPNYLFEILLFVVWSLPASGTGVLGIWYSIGTPIFLLLIMLERSARDDRKCSQKYGEKWKEYCSRVPYRIIPYIF